MVQIRCMSLSAGALLLAASTVATATTQRTFVSASGVDNPSCSLAAPCRSFATAITATSAGGEVIVLDSAGYGPVTVTKSMSIIAPPGIYAGITVSSGNGVTINAPGATVVLRGLSINGQGGANGILSQAAARVRVESCVVSNMGAVGIYHQAANGEMIVLDTIVRDTADTGLALVAANASIVLDRVRSEHNLNAGFYVAPVVPATFARASVSDSLFASNGGNAIWADSVGGAVTYMTVDRTLITDSGSHGFYATAGAAGALVNATLTRNTFNTASDAIYALGNLPAHAWVYVSENSTNADFVAQGAGAQMSASANAGPSLLSCPNTATLVTLNNNNMGRSVSVLCNLVVGGT